MGFLVCSCIQYFKCGGFRLIDGNIHQSKCWMPIHYDIIKDGQPKNQVIFYSLSKIRVDITTILKMWTVRRSLHNMN